MTMAIQIFERKDGEDLDQYVKTIKTLSLDKDNCVTIVAYEENGDEYLIQIPTKDFSEFVRMCQKMKATLA